MRVLLLTLALTGSLLAQGRFDLFEGTWAGKTAQGKRLQLHTGSSVHEFELEYDQHWVVRGEYRVTATKGQPHVSFKPTSILEDGQSRKYVEVENWPLKLGSESRSILNYGDKQLTMDVFGPEIEFYWRIQLESVEPR
jgi:hypothetical protein